jgi:hypothetical protein
MSDSKDFYPSPPHVRHVAGEHADAMLDRIKFELAMERF